MSDWAEEIANGLAKGMARTGNEAELFFNVYDIAQALRKAKADGMRYLLTLPRNQLEQDLFKLADKIEKGEQL